MNYTGKEVNTLWSDFNDSFEKGKIYDIPVLTALKQLNILPDFDYPEKGSTRLDYQQPDQPVPDYIHLKSREATPSIPIWERSAGWRQLG